MKRMCMIICTWEEKEIAQRNLVGKPEGKRLLERFRCRRYNDNNNSNNNTYYYYICNP